MPWKFLYNTVFLFIIPAPSIPVLFFIIQWSRDTVLSPTLAVYSNTRLEISCLSFFMVSLWIWLWKIFIIWYTSFKSLPSLFTHIYPSPVLYNLTLKTNYPTSQFQISCLPAIAACWTIHHIPLKKKPCIKILLHYKTSWLSYFLYQVTILLVHLLCCLDFFELPYKISSEFHQWFPIPP